MENSPIKPRLRELFITFFSISALTIGGGYAMIPVFADRITKKKWMDEKEFYDLFAMGQAIPGTMALNTAVLVGNRLLALPGAIISFLGIMIPPFITIILVSLIFSRISEIPFVQGFLKGSYGVVIGLVAAMIFKMLKTRKWKALELIIAVLGAAALFFFMNYSLPIFFAIALLCYAINRNGAAQK
ncbi:MAG: chromate transporter [Treponema sp.]|jgi:chromate transporter|nr:chromate transporter [Treponema sp.]